MSNSILIVGGGTAGWMTALYLAHRLPSSVTISLVESQDIGTVGVGEGSTPYLKSFFESLNIDEQEWMTATDATYKSGIRFDEWSHESGYESYFHPFFNEFDKKPAEMFFYNCGLRRRGYEADANPDNYFTAAYMAEHYKSPVLKTPADTQVDYAYHFDATKLGHFLRDKAKAKGVKHHVANVTSVGTDSKGLLKSVMTDSGLKLTAKFFVDCSGFQSLLAQKALKREFVSYSDTLFNDAAVAIQTPTEQPHKFKPQTRSLALKNGWMWQIPLTSRWGNGYVYSSRHTTAKAAEAELKATLGLAEDDEVQARHLNMKVGRLNEHWAGNCVAIGLSQGFIEPLEATALMLVQFAIQNLCKVLETGNFSTHDMMRYNQEMNRLFDGVKDYISLHYLLNTRKDSQYWLDARQEIQISDNIKHLLKAWDRGEDFEAALKVIEADLVYLRPSWYCILSGMGRHPEKLKATSQAGPVKISQDYCKRIIEKHFSQYPVPN